VTACDRCLRHGLALERLGGHIDTERHRLGSLLAQDEAALVAGVGGERAAALGRELAGRSMAAHRERVEAAGLWVVCRCSPAYPRSLCELAAPPRALYLTAAPQRLAELLAEPAVAIVGARRASAYGRDTARALAAGVAGAGVTGVSGMALGIDGVAHDGALATEGRTVAVLPGGADLAYPAGHRRLHARIRTDGIAVSELPPGVRPRRWMFPARNRIIAALATMTVVVQARPRSGALLTARAAAELGRTLGAVPGPVSAPLSAGPHGLIRDGAQLVTGPQDILDAMFGPGGRTLTAGRRARLTAGEAALLGALRDGHEGAAAFAAAGLQASAGLEAVAALELAGLIARGPGGRLRVTTGP
jgi:DNA processing protein